MGLSWFPTKVHPLGSQLQSLWRGCLGYFLFHRFGECSAVTLRIKPNISKGWNRGRGDLHGLPLFSHLPERDLTFVRFSHPL